MKLMFDKEFQFQCGAPALPKCNVGGIEGADITNVVAETYIFQLLIRAWHAAQPLVNLPSFARSISRRTASLSCACPAEIQCRRD